MTTTANNQARSRLRWYVYWLLITLSIGSVTGRILAVNSVDRAEREKHLQRSGRDDWQLQRPFLSANDRSRWATVRALVEQGTYAIDEIVAEPNWDTIDKVQHADRTGILRLYSSKPPLLASIIAGEYWVIHRLTGCTLGTHPYEIGRGMLITLNVIPLFVMMVLLACLVERFGTTDWGRVYVMAAVTGATFLTTFAVVLNNHLVAAVSATIAVYAAVRIWCDGERRRRYFAIAGLFAAFTAATELPAVMLLVLLTAALLSKLPRPTLLAYVPAVIIVAAAFFATNYAAHQCLTPPYMHRSWYIYTYKQGDLERQSYWQNPSGIDRGEASVATYALHALVGHHGIFSLTPVWLLSLAGLAIWGTRSAASGCPSAGGDGTPDHGPSLRAEPGGDGADPAALHEPACTRQLALLIAIVSLACLAFYLTRSVTHRNYGGMTSGFRWMFWLAPCWSLAMLPAADRMARGRWTRAVALVLLAISVLSASYPTWNPWTHPWITNWLIYLDWLQF